jgi:hypothetical protein
LNMCGALYAVAFPGERRVGDDSYTEERVLPKDGFTNESLEYIKHHD